ncbi:MAG: NTP transferase domain-containing protein [Deltaproteobacteria bacterium]|nr:NTP transferase domain-containing protein [Deltaproteobacteria bacterium]MBW1794062.1 NTP transferase domain-containing protein [Deltaproteobacteria bacterium]MBW2329764.1 NTP transferase domain-containing protein [Deltaproteobacteria bacterium]
MNEEKLDLVVVIMAGGMGTRFWPLSTERIPKQFLNLFGDRTLLQKSFDRVSNLVPPERILVLTNVAFISMVKEQLPQIPVENIIGEPIRRDTAAAVSLAAVLCSRHFGNPVIATLTADHLIEPVALFQKTLLSAARRAVDDNALYTFGIEPTYPATGYGYLERGMQIADDDGIEHFRLVRFKEKPDLETARQYVESGRFYWNSGMFVWTADAILKEIEMHLPGHARALSRVATFDQTPQWDQALKAAFESLHAVSIDFGVMEKAQNVCCVASRFSWSDVGGWLALKSYLPGDEAGNRCRGKAMTLDATDNLVFCEDPRETMVLIGVKDLVIVRAGSKTLVTHKDRTEDIKKLVQAMEND